MKINFKNKREEKGLSRESASQILKISKYHLRNIETGQRFPSRSLISRMNTVYSFSKDELVSTITQESEDGTWKEMKKE